MDTSVSRTFPLRLGHFGCMPQKPTCRVPEGGATERISKRLMNWAPILEDAARQQAITTGQMPFIHPHLALMPDAHLEHHCRIGDPDARRDHPGRDPAFGRQVQHRRLLPGDPLAHR